MLAPRVQPALDALLTVAQRACWRRTRHRPSPRLPLALVLDTLTFGPAYQAPTHPTFTVRFCEGHEALPWRLACPAHQWLLTGTYPQWHDLWDVVRRGTGQGDWYGLTPTGVLEAPGVLLRTRGGDWTVQLSAAALADLQTVMAAVADNPHVRRVWQVLDAWYGRL
jgi:hypothetical protein